jgi:hypothetical protein
VGRQPLVGPAFPRGDSSLSGISCTASTACIAVGGDARGLIAGRWNGSGWSIQHAENAYGEGSSRFSAVSCSSSTTCTAVGATTDGDLPTAPLVERWTDGRWSIQQPLIAPHTADIVPGSELSSVSCPSPTSCTAVGFRWDGSYYAPLLERWTDAPRPTLGQAYAQSLLKQPDPTDAASATG